MVLGIDSDHIGWLCSEEYEGLMSQGQLTVDSLLGSLSLSKSDVPASAVVLVMPTNSREVS